MWSESGQGKGGGSDRLALSQEREGKKGAGFIGQCVQISRASTPVKLLSEQFLTLIELTQQVR